MTTKIFVFILFLFISCYHVTNATSSPVSNILNCNIELNNKCTTCASGYYLDTTASGGGFCIPNPTTVQNCAGYTFVAYGQPPSCNSCNTGYVQIPSAPGSAVTACLLPASIPIANCVTFTSSTRCSLCADGYFVTDNSNCNILDVCSSPITNCNVYSSLKVCSTCGIGTYWDPTTGTCATGIANCAAGQTSSTPCGGCAIGYYATSNIKCDQAIAFCATFGGNPYTCSTCAPGYYLTKYTLASPNTNSNTADICTKGTSDHVATYTNKFIYVCADGYNFVSTIDKCVANIANCATPSPQGPATKCSACKTNFYLSQDQTTCSSISGCATYSVNSVVCGGDTNGCIGTPLCASCIATLGGVAYYLNNAGACSSTSNCLTYASTVGGTACSNTVACTVVTAVCASCGTAYYLSNAGACALITTLSANCVAAVKSDKTTACSNTVACDASPVCGSCAATYYLKSTDNSCTTYGNCATMVKSDKTTACSNTVACDASPVCGSCIAAANGVVYALNNAGVCSTITNCLTYSSYFGGAACTNTVACTVASPLCTTCAANFVPNLLGTLCVSPIDKCGTYLTTTQCTACQDGYYKVATVKVDPNVPQIDYPGSCLKTLPQCTSQLTATLCTSCATGYVLGIDTTYNYFCSNQVPYCTTYGTSPTTCAVCNNGFTLSSGGGSCKATVPITNCATYSSDSTLCYSCNAGSFIDRNNKICGPVANCDTFNDDLTCKTCRTNFFPNGVSGNVKSNQCGEIQYCLTFSSDGKTCQTCQSGYFADLLGKICGKVNYCSVFPSSGAITCTTCLNGYSLSTGSGACLQGIIPFCNVFSSNLITTCTTCANGYFLANNNKMTCTPGRITGCNQYEIGGQKCLSNGCAPGLFPNTAFTQCGNFLNCNTFSSDGSTCTQCAAVVSSNTGFAPCDNTNKACKTVSGPASCLLFGGSIDKTVTCNQCNAGYFTSPVDKSCIASASNCATSTVSNLVTSCSLCQSGFSLLAGACTGGQSVGASSCNQYATTSTCASCPNGPPSGPIVGSLTYFVNALQQCQVSNMTMCTSFTNGVDGVTQTDGGDLCSTCANGYSPTGIVRKGILGARCTSKIANCLVSDQSSGGVTCLTCLTGYVLSFDALSCNANPISGCASSPIGGINTFGGKNICTACYPGFVLSSDSLSCTAGTVPNCVSYVPALQTAAGAVGLTVANCGQVTGVTVSCAATFYLTSTFTCAAGQILNCATYSDVGGVGAICVTCVAGYFMNTASTTCTQGTIKYCSTYVAGGVTCSVCNNGFVLSQKFDACLSPIVFNCASYSDVTAPTVCNACEAGYFLANNRCAVTNVPFCNIGIDSNFCKSCLPGFTMNSLGTTCTANIVNCIAFNSANPSLCTSCTPGYTTTGSACTISIANCLTFDNASPPNCKSCASTFYLASPTSCVAGSINGCGVYTSAKVCLTCQNGFYLANTVGDTCSPSTISNCNVLNTANLTNLLCTTCANTYFLSLDSKSCQLGSIANCNNYVQGGLKCVTCAAGYQSKPADDGTCASLIQYCTGYSTAITCSACSFGYTLTFDATLCVMNTFSCAVPESLTTCYTCPAGTIMTSDKKCSSLISNCMTYTTVSVCGGCKLGYTGGNCNVAVANCLALDSATTCLVCATGYFLSSTRTTCTKGTIASCINYDLSGATCIDCDVGYLPANSSTTCAAVANSSIIANCKLYNSLTGTCGQCAPSYIPTVDGKKCPTAGTNVGCALLNADATTCNLCMPGYLPSAAGTGCTALIPNCNNLLVGLCFGCANTFFLSNDHLSCVATGAITNCVTYATATTCANCGTYYLATNFASCNVATATNCGAFSVDGSSCVTCKSGYALSGGACAGPYSSVVGCNQYSTPTACAQCNSGMVISADGKTCGTGTIANCLVYSVTSPYPCVTCNSATQGLVPSGSGTICVDDPPILTMLAATVANVDQSVQPQGFQVDVSGTCGVNSKVYLVYGLYNSVASIASSTIKAALAKSSTVSLSEVSANDPLNWVGYAYVKSTPQGTFTATLNGPWILNGQTYTIKAFCNSVGTLAKTSSEATGATASWKSPDNGARPILFAFALNGTLTSASLRLFVDAARVAMKIPAGNQIFLPDGTLFKSPLAASSRILLAERFLQAAGTSTASFTVAPNYNAQSDPFQVTAAMNADPTAQTNLFLKIGSILGPNSNLTVTGLMTVTGTSASNILPAFTPAYSNFTETNNNISISLTLNVDGIVGFACTPATTSRLMQNTTNITNTSGTTGGTTTGTTSTTGYSISDNSITFTTLTSYPNYDYYTVKAGVAEIATIGGLTAGTSYNCYYIGYNYGLPPQMTAVYGNKVSTTGSTGLNRLGFGIFAGILAILMIFTA